MLSGSLAAEATFNFRKNAIVTTTCLLSQAMDWLACPTAVTPAVAPLSAAELKQLQVAFETKDGEDGVVPIFYSPGSGTAKHYGNLVAHGSNFVGTR